MNLKIDTTKWHYKIKKKKLTIFLDLHILILK